MPHSTPSKSSASIQKRRGAVPLKKKKKQSSTSAKVTPSKLRREITQDEPSRTTSNHNHTSKLDREKHGRNPSPSVAKSLQTAPKRSRDSNGHIIRTSGETSHKKQKLSNFAPDNSHDHLAHSISSKLGKPEKKLKEKKMQAQNKLTKPTAPPRQKESALSLDTIIIPESVEPTISFSPRSTASSPSPLPKSPSSLPKTRKATPSTAPSKPEAPQKSVKPETPQDSSANASLSTLQQKHRSKLEGSQFRWLNEQLYTSTSRKAVDVFSHSPELFDVYHKGFDNQVANWPLNPVDIFIRQLLAVKNRLVVADFGCGQARLAAAVHHQHTVHSFDLVKGNDFITVADIANVPLKSATVDIGIFCLSLMGVNYGDFILEGARVIRPGGLLKVAEVTSRFQGKVKEFVTMVEKVGFKLQKKDERNTHFILFTFLRGSNPPKRVDGALALKPCQYKKR